jgi:hypothetical protein
LGLDDDWMSLTWWLAHDPGGHYGRVAAGEVGLWRFFARHLAKGSQGVLNASIGDPKLLFTWIDDARACEVPSSTGSAKRPSDARGWHKKLETPAKALADAQRRHD